MLDSAELAARVNIILPAAIRYVRQMPADVLDGALPEQLGASTRVGTSRVQDRGGLSGGG